MKSRLFFTAALPAALLLCNTQATGASPASDARHAHDSDGAESYIVIRYRDHVKTTMEQVQAQIADAKEAARLDAATREATVTRLSKNQRVITAKCQEIENVIAKLTAAAQVSATTEGAA